MENRAVGRIQLASSRQPSLLRKLSAREEEQRFVPLIAAAGRRYSR